ncbi:ArsR/SmtB family transcription factor [Rahnella perminowiae]|uniref:ArsR/SmtB family transcription factor n=1 Tax=Rahnella perminowiae TaxID=2816244 RepID=UPI001C260F4A|nr:helix-turn-helix domain-containing protein [Rahnella perminowiae]MBU9809252.1 helix-turn-helix transcriptional regulator [Rahnella perminowiae]
MLSKHPDAEQIRLENVLTALGNPLRLTVVRVLAGGGEHACSAVLSGIPKSTLTHHWRVLRDSGVIWQRPFGRENLLSLRREDLNARFPGLLDALLGAVENDALTQESTTRNLPMPSTEQKACAEEK